MIAVPFIYFSLLFLYIYSKKRTIDVSAYIVLLYLVTSFFAIVIDYLDIYSMDTPKVKISIPASLSYCFILTFFIWPFYKFDSQSLKRIDMIRNKKSFDYIVYLFFIVFLGLIFIFYSDIKLKLTGNISEYRALLYEGEGEDLQAKLTGILRIVSSLLVMIGSNAYIMILFFFYSLCFLKKSIWYNLMILISATSPLLISITQVDRSRFIYFFILIGLYFFLFKKFLDEKQRKVFLISSSVLLVFVTIYFIIVSTSRFDDGQSGLRNGLIQYAGQPYINYSNLFDNFHYAGISLRRVFPMLYYFVLDNEGIGQIQYNAMLFSETGIHTYVFSTFIGLIMVDIGFLGMLIWTLILVFIMRKSLFRQESFHISFRDLIIFHLFVCFPVLGLFGYWYSNYVTSFGIIIYLFLYLSFCKLRFD